MKSQPSNVRVNNKIKVMVFLTVEIENEEKLSKRYHREDTNP